MIADRTGLQKDYPASWRWLRIARRIGGWLTDAEGNALYDLARHSVPQRNAVIVELGSWQGKSSVVLGAGLSGKEGARLFCIDPFGDDENPRYQREFYDPAVSGLRLSLEEIFQRNIRRCGLTNVTQAIKGYSFDVVRGWDRPIDMLFIDASHDYEAVHRDLLQWSRFLKLGGIVALHDVSATWPGPSRVMAEDLQPPYFMDPKQADSLLWATKQSDQPLPERPVLAVTTIPKSDFDARQAEIARLTSDRKYLMEERVRQTSETLVVERTNAALEAKYAELEAKYAELHIRAESADLAASERIDHLAGRIAALEDVLGVVTAELQRAKNTEEFSSRELQRITTAVADALHANESLKTSWSWRLTAPLRLLVDATVLLRGSWALPRRANFRRLADWLLFRRQVTESGLFDRDYYVNRYPDVARGRLNPLFHFFLFGTAERRQPNFLFDTKYYLDQNPHVASSGVNPLVHYLKSGAYEGRNPHPAFDSSFYLEQNPDVREQGINPLAHYLGPGTPEGRDPNPWFHTSSYLDEHAHIAVAGINPLEHHLSVTTNP